jgi:hypothetical protein
MDYTYSNRLARSLNALARIETQKGNHSIAAGLKAEARSIREGKPKNDPRTAEWRQTNKERLRAEVEGNRIKQ